MEWMNEVKLSPTLSPELDEEYQARCDDEEAEHNARWRHWRIDLIWHNCLEIEEYNLNLRARQLDVREAHPHRCEHRCDHRESEIRAARLRGMGTGRVRGHSRGKGVLCIIYFPKSMLGVVQTLLGE
jgi:hypothetical protein